jgi:hypothetical protein
LALAVSFEAGGALSVRWVQYVVSQQQTIINTRVMFQGLFSVGRLDLIGRRRFFHAQNFIWIDFHRRFFIHVDFGGHGREWDEDDVVKDQLAME